MATTSTRKHNEFMTYVLRYQQFTLDDWTVYSIWVGMMLTLLGIMSSFFLVGWWNGVQYPAYVWNLPIGNAIFALAIAIDTIGHRTIYKEELAKAEALVHHITIFCGITSCVLLSMAYTYPEFLRIPAITMIILSIFYSMIDEGMHWKRYFELKSDRVEMWAHCGIFVGHFIMIGAWWYWFESGYPGVAETLAVLGL